MTSTNSVRPVPDTHSTQPQKDEIGFVDIIRIVLEHWKLLLVFILGCTILTNIGTRFLSPEYQSSAVVIPSDDSEVGGGLSALLGGLPGNLGGGGGSSKVSYIESLIESRRFSRYVVSKRNILPQLFPDLWDEETQSWKLEKGQTAPTVERGASQLSKNIQTKYDIDKNTIKISYSARSAMSAYKICGHIVTDLHEFIQIFEGQKEIEKLGFIKSQQLKNQAQLLEAGKELSNYYEKQNISASASMLNVTLRGDQISKAEVVDALTLEQIAQKTSQATSQIEKLSEQFKKQRFQVNHVPHQVYLEYLTIKKSMLSELTAMLGRQYEMTAIQSRDNARLFQLLDSPYLPGKPFKPRVVLLTILAAFLSTFAGLVMIFGWEYLKVLRKELKQTPTK